MRVLVVSPHFDDAPLSLGQSLIDGDLATPRVTVAVVFGRTNWIRWMYPTRRRAPIAGAVRRAEELFAAARFGYRLRIGRREEAMLRLGTTDTAAYLDPTFDASQSPELPAVIALIEGWAADADHVLVPLGLGDHVDHLVCAEAGRVLAGRGVPVGFYEDRPYVSFGTDDDVNRRAEAVDAALRPVDVSGPITAAKRRRLFYPSQIDDTFERALRLDTETVHHERVWVDPETGWPIGR